MKLVQLLEKNAGMILTRDAAAAGLSRQELYELCKNGKLERVAQGVYLSVDTFDDAMYRIQARNTKAIYSHGTALYLHQLTDRTPHYYTITVPSGYNPSRLIRDEKVKVFYVKKDFHELGLIKASTEHGREIITYDLERTICDVLRSRNHLDVSLVVEAIKAYAKRKDKDLTSLTKYARLFGIEKIIRSYLEVLL